MKLKLVARNKRYIVHVSKMYRNISITLLVLFTFANTCNSFPNSDITNHRPNAIDIFYQRQYLPYNKQILNWGSSKIEDGIQSVKSLWNIIKNKIRQPVLERRTYFTELSSRQPETIPLWRSMLSKAWNYVSGFFQKSERYFAKRRMDTDRQGVVPAFIPTAPIWAMPLAMVGVAVLLRDPLSMLSNEIACKYIFGFF